MISRTSFLLVSFEIFYVATLLFLLGGGWDVSLFFQRIIISGATSPFCASLNNTTDTDANIDYNDLHDTLFKCPAWGCPYKSQEVIFDHDIHQALYNLRKVEYDSRDFPTLKKHQEIVRLLQPLLDAGNGECSTFSLKGKTNRKTHDTNQDCAVIYSPFDIRGGTKNWASSSAQFMGAFDGHGYHGESASQYVAQEIPRLLSTKLSQLDEQETTVNRQLSFSQAIQETFLQVNEGMDPLHGQKSGTTATVILKIDNELYIASAGDSRTFVAVFLDETVYIVYESRSDKPNYPEERERIEENGGRVIIHEEEGPLACTMDESYSSVFCTSTSRAIGDWDMPGVIAEPIVDVRSVEELIASAQKSRSKEVCDNVEECPVPLNTEILAFSITDGDFFVEAIDMSDVAFNYAASFFVKGNLHPHTASEYVLTEAAIWWGKMTDEISRNDMAIAAMKIWP